jgi:hypothetical protein
MGFECKQSNDYDRSECEQPVTQMGPKREKVVKE